MAKLIKIDRNGSKHYEGMVTCDRCQGRGWFATGTCNGQLVPARPDNAVCYKCNGEGKVYGKWIERTPEYQAKLDARRAEKYAKIAAEQAAAEAERKAAEEKRRAEAEARKAAEEARIKAEKAISQYVGEVGGKVEIECTYIGSPWFEVRSFSGYGVETMYIHTFKDANGNKIVWKTGKFLGLEEGMKVTVKGTVKAQDEYKDEKQTVLTRCKVTA